MLKTSFDIIAEACKSENSVTNNINDCFQEDDFIESMDDIDEMDEEDEMECTAEMVNVILSRGTYFIEMSDLAKYLSNNRDGLRNISEAVFAVAEKNCIEAKDVAVVTDSDDVAEELVEDEKNSKGKTKEKAKKKMKGFKDAVTNLKDNGIKVVKKPSKKKR